MRYWDGFRPPPNVSGPELKIERAHYHIDLLWEEIREFFKAHRDFVAVQCDLETRDKVWIVAEEPPTPPLYLSTLIGDTLYNLRSALDHLANELVRANGNEPTSRTAFPVVDTSESDYDRVAPKQVKGMHPQAAAAIKRLQPYNRSHRYRDKWLSLLNHLGNVDKHRHFHLVIPATGGFIFDRAVPMDTPYSIHQGVLELGSEIARLPEEQMDVEGGFFPEIAFDDPRAPNEPVYQLLIAMREFVKTIVAEFRRDFIR